MCVNKNNTLDHPKREFLGSPLNMCKNNEVNDEVRVSSEFFCFLGFWVE